ncbi:type III PLP-dependent enzyme [Spongiibacter taiwanensis]|uniref:type III PLP-dependent enzyme n=1 Tax=Spongiibacter taiwanensis TaxID=1748242 RepID=UPI002035BB83|nr:type III PLP-dependent enzyme [Spongiibacter taiwanensis]USA43907.1 type III PLP-dependent enzyme [Spongiibacter taiwanensis]
MKQEVLSEAAWQRIVEFAADKATPCLVLDLQTVRDKYRELIEAFPFAGVYYAVKANPDAAIIRCLQELGAHFDIASVFELRKLLELGIATDRMSYGNTIKKSADIAFAFEQGVSLFASDCESDIRKLAKFAPGSRVYIRVLTEGSETADWPLSRKFGCQADMAIELILLARELGLVPYGISFHVGSQQRDIGTWDAAIAKVRFIFDRLAEADIHLEMINMGGGMPANYANRHHDIAAYGAAIRRFLDEDFGNHELQVLIEPGRSLVAEAGVLVSEVIQVSRKSQDSLDRWVYLDVGLFGGMIEAIGEAIQYPMVCDRQEGELDEVVIAGPTCDSMDILYEDHRYSLPLDLQEGDRLYWLTTGAYTTSYSSIEFNGFPPLQSYVVDEG